MICYKDRAWCSRSVTKECINIECMWYFTERERGASIQWWGSEDAPIAIMDNKGEVFCNYQKGEDCG